MLMLLDSAGLYYRAFHGVPESITAPDGTPVNAVRGFLDMCTALVASRTPTGLVACWDDDWRPEWRVDLLASYKAHRVAADGAEDEPETLGVQVGIIAEVLAALGIARVGAADFEADDVIATLARRHAARGEPVEVVTGDRDLIQLVDDASGVRVLYTGRGIRRVEVLDEAAVVAAHGVRPQQYTDLAILRGDPSDGLPGVPGIGSEDGRRPARALHRHGRDPARRRGGRQRREPADRGLAARQPRLPGAGRAGRARRRRARWTRWTCGSPTSRPTPRR